MLGMGWRAIPTAMQSPLQSTAPVGLGWRGCQLPGDIDAGDAAQPMESGRGTPETSRQYTAELPLGHLRRMHELCLGKSMRMSPVINRTSQFLGLQW